MTQFRNKIDEKEEFLEGVNSQKFSDMNEAILLAESEIIHLHKKAKHYIRDIRKVETMIESGQKKYFQISKNMEQAIHKYICSQKKTNERDRRNLFREMEARY